MGTITNRPIAFPGTPEEAMVNKLTHDWTTYEIGEPPVCDQCGIKSWWAGASYPCGTSVPRETVELDSGPTWGPGDANYEQAKADVAALVMDYDS